MERIQKKQLVCSDIFPEICCEECHGELALLVDECLCGGWSISCCCAVSEWLERTFQFDIFAPCDGSLYPL